jgi:hypothetical protein
MTDEELQTRLVLISLLPPGSPEREKAQHRLIRDLLPLRAYRALELARLWWCQTPWLWNAEPTQRLITQLIESERQHYPRQVLRLLPGLADGPRQERAREWLCVLLADPCASIGHVPLVLAHIERFSWPLRTLVLRVRHQPDTRLLAALLSHCLLFSPNPRFIPVLLRIVARRPPRVWRALSTHLGREVLRVSLKQSRHFLEQAAALQGDTEAMRVLLRGAREARLVLRLRIRCSQCRMRWAPRVDAWLLARPQTEFYKALRQELSYFYPEATR